MRIWHQSFTVLEDLPAYREALAAHFAKVCRPDTEVVLHGMRAGTYETEYPGQDLRYQLALELHAQQFVLGALAAERDGFDGFAIATIPDAGLAGARAAVDIPVVAYGEAAMHTACMLGWRFGILNFIAEISPLLADNARRYGLGERLAACRHVGFTFHDVVAAFDEPGPVVERFEAAARTLIRDDGADVIIPGEAPLCVFLARQGISRVDDVPVLDALAVTMKLAESFVELRRSTGLAPSRRGYFAAPPPRGRLEELLRFYGLERLLPGST